jgi:hypothetical protein
MKKPAKSIDPQSVFCQVCAARVARSEAVMDEARDYTAYFCSAACYERWRGARAPEPAAADVQEGTGGRSRARDDRLKRAQRRHPRRDAPR